MPTFDVLLAGGRAPAEPVSLPPRDGEAALGALLAHPARPDGAPWVRAAMVSTVDGGAWGEDDRSGSINNPADHRVFLLQRALADVVLVGAGTFRDERYTPLERPAALAGLSRTAGVAPTLVTAVVTRSGAVPPAMLAEGATTLVYTTAEGARPAGDDPRIVVVDDGSGDVDLRAVVADLAARGLPRVVTEGGPHLLGALVRADLLDELVLTTSPLLVGAPPGRIVAGGEPVLHRDARLDTLLHSDGVLVARWLLRPT